MGLITDVRLLTSEVVEKIKEAEQKINDHKARRRDLSDIRYAEIMDGLQGGLEEIKREYQNAVKKRVEEYQKSVMVKDALDGSKLTDDANLLSGAFPLMAADLDSMMERASGNRTMEKLIANYAAEHGLQLAKPFYTAKQKAAAAEEFLNSYARNVCSRPEFYDLFGSDEYFNDVTPEAIRGE